MAKRSEALSPEARCRPLRIMRSYTSGSNQIVDVMPCWPSCAPPGLVSASVPGERCSSETSKRTRRDKAVSCWPTARISSLVSSPMPLLVVYSSGKFGQDLFLYACGTLDLLFLPKQRANSQWYDCWLGSSLLARRAASLKAVS
jgi:hypothetical protein